MSRQEHQDVKIAAANIIKRREIDPLLLKIRKLIQAYEGAADCGVSVLDQDDWPLESSGRRNTFFFCALCRQYCRADGPEGGEGGHPCSRLYNEGIAEARRRGGAYIYMCEIGFIYWISPVYSNGHYAGALASGGVLVPEREKFVEKLQTLSGGTISGEKAEEYLRGVPEKNHGEIKALARLLHLCAEQLSGGIENYGKTAKQIAGQESGPVRLTKNPFPGTSSGAVYPLDKERMLLAALRRGDNDMGRKILREILDIVLISNPGNFEFIRMRAIELVVLLSRAAVSADTPEDKDILEINNRCLRRIQESKNIDELTGNLHYIIERMAGYIFSFKGVRHASALRKAERFIWENYTRKISLQEAADISGLSAPYFSTIFKEEMGENFSTYINRLRVEKAVFMMRESDLTLSEIAEACGFEDQSWFSKIFKNYTGMSPGKYRGKDNGANEFDNGEGQEKCSK